MAEQKAPEEAALDLRLNTELTSSELKATRDPELEALLKDLTAK